MKRMASPRRPVDVSLIKSCRKPASVNSRVRRAPPGVVSASSTSTCNPVWARTIAAASPFGPAPITHALPFIAKPSGDHPYFDDDVLIRAYGRGCTVGHSMTSIWPSASRSSVGAYSPNNSRRHHIPVERFCLMVVNQYCQSTERI